MSKFLLTVCAFGLLLSSSAFAEGKSPEQHGEFAKKVLGSTELQWKQVFAKDGRGPSTPSFDHLVSKGEQRWRNFETERLRGLEIDHQFEPSRLHNG